MASAIINSISIPSPALKSLFSKTFCITSPTCMPLFHKATTSLPKLKCSSNSPQERDTSKSLKDALSGMVDKQIEELLSREENRVLFDGLEKASARVERAKKELAEIERQELEAKQLRDYINLLESKASEIAACQQEILEARAMVEEAGSSLSPNANNGGDTLENVENNEDVERWESIKAASISALVGSLAGLPFSFTQATDNAQLILPTAITFISCALFGVTFRYAVRRDLDNFQLKTGTSAAFGFVKGLGMLAAGPPLQLNFGSFLSHAFDGAVYVSENLLIFVFAAVSLDFCFKMGLLSPFPMKGSASRIKTD